MEANVKLETARMKTRSGAAYEVGSGNVFADLELPDAQELHLKSRLAMEIRGIIERRGLTQVRAAEIIGLDQPRVSKLMRGRLNDFSVERLLVIVQRLGHSIEVRIDAQERAPQETRAIVLVA